MSLFQQQQHAQNPLLAQQGLKEQTQSTASPNSRTSGNINEMQSSEIGAMLGSKQQNIQQVGNMESWKYQHYGTLMF